SRLEEEAVPEDLAPHLGEPSDEHRPVAVLERVSNMPAPVAVGHSVVHESVVSEPLTNGEPSRLPSRNGVLAEEVDALVEPPHPTEHVRPPEDIAGLVTFREPLEPLGYRPPSERRGRIGDRSSLNDRNVAREIRETGF